MKHLWRFFFLSKRRKLSEKWIEKNSPKISRRVFGLRAFQKARVIASYVDFNKEPPTARIIQRALKEGKIVAVPRMLPKTKSLAFCQVNSLDELVLNPKGILEPPKKAVKLSPKEIELVIVPGIAFDEKGFRLGFGHGYFDRSLKRFSRAAKIGLAFEEFVVFGLPRESHDVRVDCLVTEKKVRWFS